MICPKCNSEMKSALTRKSVLIDVCTRCNGKWLDQGELRFFVSKRGLLENYDRNGISNPQPTHHNCPNCETEKLNSGRIPGTAFPTEECPACKGLFFDNNELEEISDASLLKGFEEDRNIKLSTKQERPSRPTRGPVIKMASLGLTSGLVLGSLYAVLFGLVVFLVEAGFVPLHLGTLFIVGFVILQFIFSPWIMDWSLRFLGSLDWIGINQLPQHLQEFLPKLCRENKIPMPKLGIIRDGSPQAFTYGRTPSSARVVISQGLLDLLEPDEVEAVVAHEMGHVKHWDFVVMTLAQLVPILLYQVYRFCIRASRSSGGKKNQGKAGLLVAAIVAYVAYTIANYLVNFISRLREYWADRFSVYYTKKPNSLIYALTKIGFGLVTSKQGEKDEDIKDMDSRKRAVQAMGIMSINNSKEIALAFQGDNSGALNPEVIKQVMRWDLWSPWAAYYELHSTHPLTAKRINAIAAHGLNMGVEPDVIFDQEKPESYWDDFAVDLVCMVLPAISAIAGVALYIALYGTSTDNFSIFDFAVPFTVGLAMGGLIKTFMIYPTGPFLNSATLGLLKKIKVSPVRSFPVTMKGHIIGRGDAGNIFSEDMVLQDKTGIMFLDYQQPLGLFNLFFALFKMKKFRGHDVVAEGWFRRSPVPYVEIKRIKSKEASSTSYTFHFKILGWILLPAIVIGVRLYLQA